MQPILGGQTDISDRRVTGVDPFDTGIVDGKFDGTKNCLGGRPGDCAFFSSELTMLQDMVASEVTGSLYVAAPITNHHTKETRQMLAV